MYPKKTIKQLKPYNIVSQEAWQEQNTALKLDWNESTREISPFVRDALIESIQNDHLNWYPNLSNNELNILLSEYVGISSSNILTFASSDSAQEYIARTFLEAYDDVIIVAPTYDNFRVTCQSQSYNIYFSYLTEALNKDIEQLCNKIEKVQPKLVYISNPNNPTGTEYSINEIESLISKFKNVLFLVDEAYIEFSSLESSSQLVKAYKNLIVCRTFSKAFGLAGFRIGYIISNEINLDYINRIRNPKSITTLTQVAALAALKDKDYMLSYVKDVNKAKKYVVEELTKLSIPFKIGGGNFVLLKIKDNDGFVDYLKKRQIYIRNYSHIESLHGFKCRITIGTMNEMERIFNHIHEYISNENCNF